MRQRSTLITFILGFWLAFAGLMPAIAQSSVPPDQQALDYAMRLYGLYEQADNTGNWNAFYTACAADVVMTRKAYVAALGYADQVSTTDPEGAQEAIAFAEDLATLLAQSGDTGPATISQAIANGYSRDQVLQLLMAYRASLYAQYANAIQQPANTTSPSAGTSTTLPELDPATTRYGDDKSRVADLDPIFWALLKPIQIKAARVDLATSFANPRLAIQELDGFASVARRAYDDALRQGGTDSPSARAALEKLISLADAPKLVTLSEMGLSREFDAGLESVLKATDEPDKKAGTLLAGLGQALERGDDARARQLMARIRPALAGAKHVPPALEYGIRTAEFRVAHLGKAAPTLPDLAAGLQKSWEAVRTFRPYVIVADDGYWYFARRSTRYWLREMSAFPGGTAEVSRIIGQTIRGWTSEGQEPRETSQGMTLDDYALHYPEITNSVGVTLALVDQILAVLEIAPEPPDEQFLDGFEKQVKDWGYIAENAGWTVQSPGFPAYDLTRGGLYSELLGRAKFLRARNRSLSPQKAVPILGEALKLIKEAGFPETSVDMMLKGGRLYQSLGRPDLALAEWKEALALSNSYSYVDRSAEAASLLAQEYGRQDKWQEAGLYADQASAKLQESVVSTSSPFAQQKLSQTTEKVAEVSVKAAVKANDPQKAYAAVVKGKDSESAAAQMAGQREARAQMAAVEQQKQEVAALTEKVTQLEAMPSGEVRDNLLRKTQNVLASTKAEFLLKSRELRQNFPELYSRVLKFDPLDLPDVQSALPPEAAVIQYFPTDDTLYIFLVTRDAFRLRSVTVSEKDLDRDILSFVRAIRRATAVDRAVDSGSKSLYASLIEPCKDDIKDKSILVFIPTGRLNVLPFACLSSADGTPLIQNKLVLELAKPTDFLRIQNNPPKKVESIVAFANATGDLPAAAEEGDAIAAMFPNHKLFKESQATKKNFLDFGAKAQVLHLATHGESNSENALTNYLKMSGDEKLDQKEIFALSFDDTSVVTLSACNTAIGDRTDSKFVASLAEAFWLGGSQSVVASLWAVDDASTGLLMTEFYKGLRDGKSKALALKDAQIKVRSTPGYEHPYYWAGFILFGDWR